jgi:ribosomal protein S18 acetylase RimI-like enzyme
LPRTESRITIAVMSLDAIAIRTAKTSDRAGLATVHDAAWRYAYRGVLPGAELERMISRRGPDWWGSAVRRRVPIVVLEAEGKVRGYATYGASRLRMLPYRAEIYELYIQPEWTGLGFGRRLFRTVQDRLARRGHDALVVWCLEDNAAGCAFYEGLGGRPVAQADETLGGVKVAKLAYGFGRRAPGRSGAQSPGEPSPDESRG